MAIRVLSKKEIRDVAGGGDIDQPGSPVPAPIPGQTDTPG